MIMVRRVIDLGLPFVAGQAKPSWRGLLGCLICLNPNDQHQPLHANLSLSNVQDRVAERGNNSPQIETNHGSLSGMAPVSAQLVNLKELQSASTSPAWTGNILFEAATFLFFFLEAFKLYNRIYHSFY